MPSPRTVPVSAELAAAHDLCRELQRKTTYQERHDLAFRLLLHPASQERLRSACGTVMRRWARHIDLRHDVYQEATCELGDKLVWGVFPYEDRGTDAFGHWLWALWWNACRNAWGRCRPLWLRGFVLCADAFLDESTVQGQPEESLGFLELWDAVGAGFSREVLCDWLAGYSARESAKRQGVSRPTIQRQRLKIAALWRRLELPHERPMSP